MSEQSKALKWAKKLEANRMWPHDDLDLVAAKELRRLHDVNQELVEALETCVSSYYMDIDGDWVESKRFDSNKVKAALKKARGEE